MPRFLYLSGPQCADAGFTTAYGVEFAPGASSEVVEPLAVRKLRGNQFFREVADGDADGDGEVSKAELMAQLDERGIDYDKRWGAKRLADLLG